MTNRTDLEANYEVISQACKLYRKELTIYQAVIIDIHGLDIDINDYIEFMNTLSLDTFIGNMLCDLLVHASIDIYKKLLTNELTFEEFVEKDGGICDINKFHELMERF
jgi:hypothetical protein